MAKLENKESKLSEIQKSNAELVPVVAQLSITTPEENKNAIDMSNQIKARIKRVEELRLFFVGDLTKKVNEINAEFRSVRKPLEDMLGLIDSKLIDWRRKEQAKIDEAQSEELEFDDSDFQQSKTVHSESGATTFKTVTDFEVVNPLEIPREYMQVDLVAIRKAVKSGVKNIPGVRIFETETVNRKL